MFRNAICVALLLGGAADGYAQSSLEFRVRRASEPPVIDAALDDPAWDSGPLPLTGDWVSYSPLHGEKGVQRTEVFVTFDDRNLYFAFHCFDTEPDRIRTTISRRDNAFNDDWMAISLDSNGTGQSAYHLFMNPSGVQMDALNTTASGEQFEADFVWDSAGKTVDDGYVVEVRIPLQSIRFSSGSTVRMGMRFFRRISRTGVSVAWPEMLPGQWVFNNPSQLVFENLEQRRLLELLPSVTYSLNQTRASSSQWNESAGDANVGFSAKYGITSAITLDATVNPDFSQVESDAFQVQVNQRFPVFFAEKRPFFMEGMGLFNLAWGGNMRRTVHTRRIIDPPWGVKLTGTAGSAAFGTLSAADESGPQRRLFNVGRAAYGFGGADYAGVLVADTSEQGRRNQAYGGDLSFRLSGKQLFEATVVTTRTRGSAQPPSSGTGAMIEYLYNSRQYSFSSDFEHYDRGFQMDGAFYNRTGMTSLTVFGERNLFPSDENFWVKRITVSSWNKFSRDRDHDGNDTFNNLNFDMNLIRQGYFHADFSRGREPWLGNSYKSGRRTVRANGQVFRWLYLSGNINWGWSTFYDTSAPFQGRSSSRNFEVTLQPNARLNQNVGYSRVDFRRASDSSRVFDVDIVNSRTTYQFSRQFFLRAILQYDSSQLRVLTDLLASYEFSPGTVLHAGYGSLIEKNPITDGRYLTVSRGLFLKGAYRHWF